MYTVNKIRKIYKDHQPEPIGRHRFFSVLVPFVVNGREISLMYEVRAKDMETDPGEICFPGGHVEEGESLVDAALRETEEETGIPSDRIQILGKGDILYGYANYTLYTYIGLIRHQDYVKAEIEKKEVDELFTVPLDHFKDARIQRFVERVNAEVADDFPYKHLGIDEEYSWRTGKWEIPIIDVDGRTIWGLTARITEGVLSLLEREG